MRTVLVSNPTSTRNRRRGMADIEAVAAARPGVRHLRLEPGERAGGTVGRIAEAGAGLVVVNSGDGTFQDVLTAVLERGDLFPRPPLLCHMARGGANMTARDCGIASGRASDLARLFAAAEADALAPLTVERRVLRLDLGGGRRPERGLFLGLGGIVDGMKRFRGGAAARGLEGALGHALTVAGLLGRAAFGGPAAARIGPH